MLAYSPNIRYETGDEHCRTEIDENRNTLEHAREFGRRGGIVTFTWHWLFTVRRQRQELLCGEDGVRSGESAAGRNGGAGSLLS